MNTFRWSFSQWEAYDGCPQKWKFRNIMKLPGLPSGPAAARGTSMHDRVERYIRGEIEIDEALRGNPEERFGDKKPAVIHEKYIPILDAYRNHPTLYKGTEHKMALDSAWSVIDHTVPEASCIAVLDAYRLDCTTLHIAEWKSGKPKDTHEDQRKLYAMFGLLYWQEERVEVTTYYLEDTSPPVCIIAVPDDLDRLKTLWAMRANLMRRDEMCAPRPGIHCNWCDYAAKKGGPCQFGS